MEAQAGSLLEKASSDEPDHRSEDDRSHDDEEDA